MGTTLTAVESNANRRARLVTLLTAYNTRPQYIVDGINALIAAGTLTAIVPTTFGLFASPAGTSTASITTGTTALTSADNVFSALDVGKTIHVAGAGAAGATLATTIAAFVSASAVTLAAAAGTTIAATTISAAGVAVWGTPAPNAITGVVTSPDGLTTFQPGTLDLSSLSTATVTSAGSSTARSLASRFADACNVRDFGAVGDGVADDTAAFTAAINFGKTGAFKNLFVPNGTYKITSALPAVNTSFTSINIVGESSALTKINVAGLGAGVPAIAAAGGSGGIAEAFVSDLQIIGSGTQYGIQNKGFCGWKFYRLNFNNLHTGIEFSNDLGAGTFTEISIAYDCVFAQTVTRVAWYHRGTGNDSFHGSGFINCDINQPASATSAAIEIGAAGEAGRVVLYNAPMDFRIWIRSTQNIINVVTGKASIVTLTGTIRVEIFGGVPTFAASDTSVYLAGKITLWSSSGSVLGKLILCDFVAVNSDSSVYCSRSNRRAYLTNASTSTFSIAGMEEVGNLVFVNIFGSNYDFKYILAVHKDNYGGAGAVVIVATLNAFNSSGWGAPAFSVNAVGTLNMVNAGYVGQAVNARVHVMCGGLVNGFDKFNE